MIVLDVAFICRYESLTFSYPIVEKDGLVALVDLLSNAWNCKEVLNIRTLFPSFFNLNRDFLSGLEYSLSKWDSGMYF